MTLRSRPGPAEGARQAEAPLAEVLVDALHLAVQGATAMALSLEVRRAYPDVVAELEALEALGIVVRRSEGRDTLWDLG
ncbi:MAG: hypothetical protein R3F61_17525 [Myxococcota bacterium]